jgi:hypothetical protein
VWIWGHGICSASSHVAGPRLTGFGLHRTCSVGRLFPGRRHPHPPPVIGKLLAAIQADDVCASLGTPGTKPSPPAGQGEGRAFVPASEQSIENCHLFSLSIWDRMDQIPVLDRKNPPGLSLTCLVQLNPSSFRSFPPLVTTKLRLPTRSHFVFSTKNARQ